VCPHCERYHCAAPQLVACARFVREHLGYIITQLDFTLDGDDALHGESRSDFVLGSDPDGKPFFQGTALVRGRRLSPSAR
jgi:hypothetical protein